jgi:hypothetical protein
LYLIKYSLPDLYNVVRELSKCMDKATMGIHLEMLRVVKFVIDTKIFVSKFVQKTKLKIGGSTYFAIVIGHAILIKNQCYWLHCLSNECVSLLKIIGPKRSDTL